MVRLSKSKYVEGCTCLKMLWLELNRPELKEISEQTKEIFETGNMIGDLAMSLFGEFKEAHSVFEDGSLDLQTMCEQTSRFIEEGIENICEASFIYDNMYCAVDILKKTSQGYDIYEVKSSTHVKDVHLIDVSFQKYILEQCGIKVNNCYVVTIDSSYVRVGELDLSRLFKINDVTKDIEKHFSEVENNIKNIRSKVDTQKEVETPISKNCMKPYKCTFMNYCFKDFPHPNVLDLYLYRNSFGLIEKGITSFDDVKKANIGLTKIQKLQVEEPELYIEKEGLKQFLNKITYPIYYLDFETMNPIIPPYDYTKPFQQIPFQYSLHIKKSENSEIIHKEFLGDGENDPMYELAKQLVNDIKADGVIIAYNKSFEESRIKELAELFPDLREQLLRLSNNFIDLIEPFTKGYVYKKEMGGSFSIKSVLPAFFKNDDELNYKKLPVVHNGSEAKNIYPKLSTMSREECNKVRKGLLMYCNLDTYAMVRIHEKLLELIK